MKKCSYCNKEKPLEAFYKSKRTKDGYMHGCKSCRIEDSKRYRERNKEKVAEANRKSIDANLPKQLHKAAKVRAKKQGIPFNIKVEDIIIPDRCPILNIPLRRSRGRPSDGSPTLDKFIPKLGYVKGNICVISHRANTFKSDATVDEIKLLLKWMLDKLEN